MSEDGNPPVGKADADDAAADQRMADVLRDSSSSNADLRAELQSEGTTQASDLLSRLNALDFVQQVVGGTGDVPKRIGAYEIRGVLGRGGMGTVYLGWQAELEREVALKVLSPSYSSDPTMRKRFRAEARATAALHHQHIVPIYDYGEAGGVLYFAMERVLGMSLDKHIAAARRVGKRPLEPLDAARRFAGVADALGLAHRRRLLHRDVKPGNILVAADGTFALTDFGLAKTLDHASMRLTSKGGGFLGTLHYSSAEQALGYDVSSASDLYSLGVTIFEAVTGELPVAGKTTEALLQSILHGTPKRLRDLVPKPPRDLEAVLDKLLSREPTDRYQDGEELARDLQRIADGEPVHIRRLPLHVRLWRRARKNPVLSGAIAAAVVLLLMTMTLLTVWRRERGQSFVLRHQEHLVAVAKDIGQERGTAHGPPGMLQALVGREPATPAPNEQVLRAIERAQKELPDDPDVPAMRSAYLDDPWPDASELLRQGRGYEALQRLDGAIVEASAARADGKLDVELRLYRLHLARGVANLTAAVSRPNAARTDLALAKYLRPGAIFPQTLLDVLDVLQSADPAAAAARLEREMQNAAPDRVLVPGLLLWTAAGRRPPLAANLMPFPMGYQAQRALHGVARRLLGEEVDGCVVAGQPVGLQAMFAGACREALGKSGDPAALRELAERTDAAIAAAVHPDATLQGWRTVLLMLQQKEAGRGPLFGPEQRQLAPAMQLAAWECLLLLSPPRSMVLSWLGRFGELLGAHPNLPGIARVAAQLHLLADSPEAEEHVAHWIRECDGDPTAHLWRLRMHLRKGALAEGCDDAMVAVQQSVAPAETLREVLRLYEEAAPHLESGDEEAARSLLAQFRTLLDRGLVPDGGYR